MNLHEVDALVRKIHPAIFSEAAHGPGYRVVVQDRGRAALYEPGVLNRIFARRSLAQYYVKRLATPLVVDSWPFRWSEGTSAVALEFTATFALQVTQPDEACRLVEALTVNATPGESLFNLIDEALHECLSAMTTASAGSQRNLLAHFRDSSVGAGESGELNRQVTDKVAARLGCRQFRIGLRLNNVPPMQIPVESNDDFVLADSTRVRKVETKALLQFDNYQTYKKAGLETEEAICDAIKKSITEAVRRNLFAVKYHDVVKSFADRTISLEEKMRAEIAADAQRLGYRVQMFQSFPGIAALDLLRGIRIDIPPESLKYRPKDSIGYVQMELAISVTAVDFDLLHRLVDPDDKQKIDQIIAQRVQQICQDEIQQIGREDFNLHFEEKIVKILEAAIGKGLAHYGLKTEVIKIVQAPTDESFRFRALCSEPPTSFVANIPAHADEGDTDSVVVEGKIEITGMLEKGWDKFEGKDFGFRADSNWTDERLTAAATSLPRSFPLGNSLSITERRALAIFLELDEIRARVVSVLREKLSKVPNLGRQWTTVERSADIERSIQNVAKAAVAAEFGLAIELRGVMRQDTDTEITNARTRSAKHDLLRSAATIDVQAALTMRKASHDRKEELLQRAHKAEGDALDEAIANNDSIPEHIAEKLSALAGEDLDTHTMRLDDARQVLKSPGNKAVISTLLPGEHTGTQQASLNGPKAESDSKG